VHDLVALDLDPGDAFVDALRRAWDDGDAVLPLDRRLPTPAQARLVAFLAPTAVVDAEGRRRLDGGRGVEDGDALVLATSGTTGDPKGVVLTHDAVAASATATSERLAVDPASDRWVACLPFAHVGGLAVLTRALVTDTPVEVHERFDPARVEDAARRGATLVSLVATALNRTDASGYRAVLLGGAAPPRELAPNVVTTYGMTETGSGIVYDGVPLTGTEVRIGDGSLGGDGEVLVRGPTLLRAYRDGARPFLAGGWLPTGDGGHLVDGRLVVHGRLADVVVTGGEKVWPGTVERVLLGLPAIAEAAVWKRPDPRWGERVVAWVVPADPDRPPTLGEVTEAVRAELAPWAAPKELEVRASLPRTPTGKVRRRDLT
jgi:O-succinylbenzoic acid--CoA ligase